jgi:hypothetical protein
VFYSNQWAYWVLKARSAPALTNKHWKNKQNYRKETIMNREEAHKKLRRSLQHALSFEFSTIPAYLYMMWSIDNRPTQTAGVAIESLLVDIVRDEMLHMSLCCNMLVSIGGTPKIYDTRFAPSYPAAFPGGIHAGAKARLLRYSPEALRQFLLVEYPKNGPLTPPCPGEFPEVPKTVGAFYEELWQTFLDAAPDFSHQHHQIEWNKISDDDNENLFKIGSLDDVERAIFAITSQGEGSNNQINELSDLSHYYQLAELCHGRKLAQNPDGTWTFTGDAITAPELVFPAAEPCSWHNVDCNDPNDVPTRNTRNVADSVIEKSLDMFNATYATLLTKLETVWATGSTSALWQAVDIMKNKLEGDVDIEGTAKYLMSRGYGPEFFI